MKTLSALKILGRPLHRHDVAVDDLADVLVRPMFYRRFNHFCNLVMLTAVFFNRCALKEVIVQTDCTSRVTS